MDTATSQKHYSRLVISFLLMGFSWTVLIAVLAIWANLSANENMTARTLIQARSFFRQIVLARTWNSLHGGVYVPVTSETRPNPYLHVTERDVVTKNGRMLTLINPSYMTRQIAEIASDKEHVRFHITSLKPIRPQNAPLAWEAEALKSFKAVSDEYHAWWLPGEKEADVFRYMAPLWVEASCLNCHAQQGYVTGALRGGISVTVPAKEILSDLRHNNQVSGFRYLLIWLIGMGGIVFFFRVSRTEYQERSLLIGKLETAFKEVKTLKGFISICASCKKVRNDQGFWNQIELYIKEHSEAEFTHSICPECLDKLYPDYVKDHNPDADPLS